jgi:short-subunit dehydrogenase involved in D-alanine esterification of teichoic acids
MRTPLKICPSQRFMLRDTTVRVLEIAPPWVRTLQLPISVRRSVVRPA